MKCQFSNWFLCLYDINLNNANTKSEQTPQKETSKKVIKEQKEPINNKKEEKGSQTKKPQVIVPKNDSSDEWESF